MSVRALVAGVLAVAAVPAVAPVAAQAANNDCVILDNQFSTIQNLYSTAIDFDNQAAATDEDDTEGYLSNMGLLRDTQFAIAERLGYVYSHLFNPAYKTLIGGWRDAWLIEANWTDRLVKTRKVPPPMPDDINDRIRDGADNYDLAHGSACA